MFEPLDLGHGGCNSLGEGGYLPLKVDEEGIGPPASDDFDGVFRDASQMEGHGTAGPKGV